MTHVNLGFEAAQNSCNGRSDLELCEDRVFANYGREEGLVDRDELQAQW